MSRARAGDEEHRGRDEGESQERGEDRQTGDKRSAAQWVSLTVSVSVVLAVVGLITYLHFSAGNLPVTVTVEPDLAGVRQEGGLFYVPADVTNRGNEPAQSVRVRVRLGGAAGSEEAETEIQYLAAGETVHVVFVFRNDPAGGQLQVGSISYLKP